MRKGGPRVMKVSISIMEKEVKSPVFARVFAFKGTTLSIFKEISYEKQIPEALGSPGY